LVLRVLRSLLLIALPSPALAATQQIPPPLLGPLADRILFLFGLWVLIVALVIILRWKISIADALFHMMPREMKRSKDSGRSDDPEV
jgi:hypothetical protein